MWSGPGPLWRGGKPVAEAQTEQQAHAIDLMLGPALREYANMALTRTPTQLQLGVQGPSPPQQQQRRQPQRAPSAPGAPPKMPSRMAPLPLQPSGQQGIMFSPYGSPPFLSFSMLPMPPQFTFGPPGNGKGKGDHSHNGGGMGGKGGMGGGKGGKGERFIPPTNLAAGAPFFRDPFLGAPSPATAGNSAPQQPVVSSSSSAPARGASPSFGGAFDFGGLGSGGPIYMPLGWRSPHPADVARAVGLRSRTPEVCQGSSSGSSSSSSGDGGGGDGGGGDGAEHAHDDPSAGPSTPAGSEACAGRHQPHTCAKARISAHQNDAAAAHPGFSAAGHTQDAGAPVGAPAAAAAATAAAAVTTGPGSGAALGEGLAASVVAEDAAAEGTDATSAVAAMVPSSAAAALVQAYAQLPGASNGGYSDSEAESIMAAAMAAVAAMGSTHTTTAAVGGTAATITTPAAAAASVSPSAVLAAATTVVAAAVAAEKKKRGRPAGPKIPGACAACAGQHRGHTCGRIVARGRPYKATTDPKGKYTKRKPACTKSLAELPVSTGGGASSSAAFSGGGGGGGGGGGAPFLPFQGFRGGHGVAPGFSASSSLSRGGRDGYQPHDDGGYDDVYDERYGHASHAALENTPTEAKHKQTTPSSFDVLCALDLKCTN